MKFQYYQYYYCLCSDEDYSKIKKDYPKYLLGRCTLKILNIPNNPILRFNPKYS